MESSEIVSQTAWQVKKENKYSIVKTGRQSVIDIVSSFFFVLFYKDNNHNVAALTVVAGS